MNECTKEHKNICCECGQCADCDEFCVVENIFESNNIPEGLESALRWHTDTDLVCKECLATLLKKVHSELSQDDLELSGEVYSVEKWVR